MIPTNQPGLDASLVIPYPFSDCVVNAAVAVQGIMAEMVGDCTLEFARLSEEQQDSALASILGYQALSDSLLTPKNLHDSNVNKLLNSGWTKGPLDVEHKVTPMLCDFDDLPVKSQSFIQAMFAVLKSMVFNVDEACL